MAGEHSCVVCPDVGLLLDPVQRLALWRSVVFDVFVDFLHSSYRYLDSLRSFDMTGLNIYELREVGRIEDLLRHLTDVLRCDSFHKVSVLLA